MCFLIKLVNLVILFSAFPKTCFSYKILTVFPYNGRSHHICFSSLVEELASRNHHVTVINYFPLKERSNVKKIFLEKSSHSFNINIEDHLNTVSRSVFGDFAKAYNLAQAFDDLAKSNCKKLIHNSDVQEIMKSKPKYDVIIVEQFVTDCHLALAHRLQAPMIGITAHVLMPWTYARLGAPHHPAFVPNRFFGSGSRPDLWNRFKNFAINSYLNWHYRYITQRNDHELVKEVYPDTPDLETLGNNISLVLLNQYFPLTGPRLYGSNVIEVGGFHISHTLAPLNDQEVSLFLNNSINGAVYISFGRVSKNFPSKMFEEIMKMIQKSNIFFIWIVDDLNKDVPKNVLLRKWVAQQTVLCHPNVKALISHSGMLSSTEAMHCGVPIVSVPLFGDQFANAASAEEVGLGVKVDVMTLDENALTEALDTVLHERYQIRAKQLSRQWKDRPLPMDTAIHWVEYIARHPDANLKPPTVDLPLYQYLMLDVIGFALVLLASLLYLLKKVIGFVINKVRAKPKPNIGNKTE